MSAARPDAAETARLKAEAEAKATAEAATTNAPTAPAPAIASATNAAPAAAPATAAISRSKIITNGIGMVLLWVPRLPGSGDGGWVGKCEVTQAEDQKVKIWFT